MLGGELALKQALMLDGLPLDPFAPWVLTADTRWE